jgi:hypothetical protein
MIAALDVLNTPAAVQPSPTDPRSAIAARLREVIGPDGSAALMDLAVELHDRRRGRPQSFVATLDRLRSEAAAVGVNPAVLPAVERAAIAPYR